MLENLWLDCKGRILELVLVDYLVGVGGWEVY